MTTTAMFVDRAARGRMQEWFDAFRSDLPFSTESRFVDTAEGRTHVLVTGPEDGATTRTARGSRTCAPRSGCRRSPCSA